MKKALLLALVSIWVSMGAFGNTSVTWLPINSNTVGYDTVRIPYSVTFTSFVGLHKEKLFVKKTGDTTWILKDSILVSGTGPRSLAAKHLLAATTYSYLVTISQDSLRTDTSFATQTFTTKSRPVFPAVTVVPIPKNGITDMILTATVTGTPSAYYAYFMYGDLLENNSLDTMFATGTKKDTLRIPTPTAQQEISYCLWLHSDLLGDTVMNCGSFVTPGLIGDSVRASVTTIGYDSITVTAKVVRDGNGSSSLLFYIKDPAALPGTYLQGYTRSVSGLTDYPVTFNGLSQNKDYEVGVVSRDTLGIDTVKTFTVRTLIRPLKPAPVARFKPGSVTLRGYIKLTGYTITISPGDIGRAVIVRGTNDSTLANMRDTVRIMGMITTNINQDSILMDAPHASMRYHWRIITWSMDGVMAVSPAISAPSEIYQEPDFLLDQVGLATSPNPYLQISGDGYGESVVIFVNITDSTGQIIWSDTLDVGFEPLNGYHLQLPNLPPGTYTVHGNLRTGRGDVLVKQILPITRISITTGIKTNTVQNAEIYPNPSNGIFNIKNVDKGDVSITTISGQEIYQGSVSDLIDISNQSAGYYVITIKNGGDMFQKKVYKN